MTNKAKSGHKHGGLDQSFTHVSTSACLDQNADVSYSLSHTRGLQMLVCNEANVANVTSHTQLSISTVYLLMCYLSLFE